MVVLGMVIDVLMAFLLLVSGWMLDSWNDPVPWTGALVTTIWTIAFVIGRCAVRGALAAAAAGALRTSCARGLAARHRLGRPHDRRVHRLSSALRLDRRIRFGECRRRFRCRERRR
jgi:hypothetical protein